MGKVEVIDVATFIAKGLEGENKIESIITFMGDKSLQVRTTDGGVFNVCIVRTQNRINRQPIYQRGRRNENDSSI